MSTTLWRAAARLLLLPLAVSLVLVGTVSTEARARTAHDLSVAQAGHLAERAADRPRSRFARRGERVVRAARSRAGSSYRYGATGPRAFDCSGLTQWSYRKVGKRLPRTSGAQVGATRRVARPRRGDLVFFHNGGRVYHVGIFAGKGTLWHASRPGTPVRKARIWTRSVFYGRVR